MSIAEFVRHYPVELVRLAEQREGLNDGQLQISGRIIDVEVTEAMELGRRRGDEYRSHKAANLNLREFDPNLDETLATQLAEAVSRKADKRYATKPLLLVYLNFRSGGRLKGEVEVEIKRLKHQYAGLFESVFVLWADKLY